MRRAAADHLTGEILRYADAALEHALETLTITDLDEQAHEFAVKILTELQHIRNCTRELREVIDETGVYAPRARGSPSFARVPYPPRRIETGSTVETSGVFLGHSFVSLATQVQFPVSRGVVIHRTRARHHAGVSRRIKYGTTTTEAPFRPG